MAIVYSTNFAGIAADQALQDFDSDWSLHPTTTYGYAGSTALGEAVFPKGNGQVCMVICTGAGVLSDCHVYTRFVHTPGGAAVSSTAVLARSDPTVRSHYGARIASGAFELYKRTNGTNVVLASVASGRSIPYDFVLGVRCQGNQIYLTVDGADTLGPITDNSFASGYPGLYAQGVSSGTNAILMDDFTVDNLGAPPDPTPPQGTTTITDVAPGTTSALVTYGYSAGDATGFEYRVGGGAVATIGASPATISGLTAGTPYSIEIRAINAAGAGAWSAPFNFSTSAAGDTTLPTLTGVVSFSGVTQTSYTASWPAGSDNVAVTGYEYQIGGTAGAWTDAGADLSEPVSGRTPGATETVYVRAYDAAGLRSTPPIAGTVTLLSASTDGTITVGSALYPIKYSSESVLNESGLRATVMDATTLSEVLNTSGVVCSAGVITITDPALVIGNTYHLVVKTAAGWTGISGPVTAS